MISSDIFRLMVRRLQSLRAAAIALACAATVLLSHNLAWAAAEIATGPDGRLAGYIAGLTMILLVGYALYSCFTPILGKPDSGFFYAVLILTAIWLVKEMVLPLFPGF